MITDADLLAAVAAHESDAREAMQFVHEHPELGHAELRCARFLTDQLMRKGLDVELGVGGMDTAFTATVQGTRPGRSVGIVCLYDAVQTIRENGEIEAVHSCGHGVIAGSVVAAALALADHRDQLAGRLVVFGCPADEIHAAGTVARGGGKALSVEAGLWEEMDVGLYSHPEFIDTVSLRSRWMRRERVRLDGARDLSGELEPPLLAAQALIGANDLDVMVEHLELDGDVEGDTSMTVQADMLLFADSEAELEERCAAVRATVPNGTWTAGITYRGVRPDDGVTASVREAFAAAGRGFEPNPPALPFATDFGNISHRVPAALIGVGRPEGWAFHTDLGREQFTGEAGFEAAIATARVLALSASRLTEPVS
jgi:metal-dependent amidase/aminoacylase/carboxypeptidase family protein